MIYLVKRTTAKTTKKCRSGGIGRRAGFRCLWSQDRVGSSPISCIFFYVLLLPADRNSFIARPENNAKRQCCIFSIFSELLKIPCGKNMSFPQGIFAGNFIEFSCKAEFFLRKKTMLQSVLQRKFYAGIDPVFGFQKDFSVIRQKELKCFFGCDRILKIKV